MKTLASKIKTIGIFLGISFCASAVSQAQTQTQTFSTNGDFSGTGITPILNSSYFAASFLPYAGPTNDLVSFTIAWSVTFSASATSSNGYAGSFTSEGPSSAYLMNGVTFSGNGGGFGSGTTNLGGVIPPQTITVGYTNVFLASEAGESYNPALLADVLSGDSVDLTWPTTFGLEYNNIGSGTYSVTGEVDLSYSPSATPEPSTLALFGMGMVGGLLVYRRHQQASKA